MVQHQVDMALDEFILQVFEEQEDQFHFPIYTQNGARAFVKALHSSKGLPFMTMCQEIGEFEHNFSAWRKGLGRPGIGNRMIERINRPLQDILMSDEEDEVDTLIQRKKNKKPTPVPELKEVLRENNGDSKQDTRIRAAAAQGSVGDRKVASDIAAEKGEGITDSWLSQIEKKTEKATQDKRSEGSENPEISDTWETKPVETEDASLLHSEKDEKQSPAETEKEVSVEKRDNGVCNGVIETDSKDDAPSESSEGSKEESDTGSEAAAVPEGAGTLDSMGPVSIESGLDSMEVVPLKSVEGDKRISCMDAERGFDDLVDEVGDGKKSLAPSCRVSRSMPAPLVAEEEDLEDEDESLESDEGKSEESSGTDSSEVDADGSSDEIDENYDSDLDPEIKDKVPELMTVSRQLQAIKGQSHDDCSGFVYVFTDSEASDEVHRVKIGASRCPHKRLQQSKAFNLDMRLVTAVAVNGQQTAAGDVARTLAAYAIEGHETWFQAPLDHIINTVSKVAEKHPATSSDC